MNIEWSDRAKSALDKCVKYITEKSSAETAQKWKGEVFESLKTLETFPKAGRKVGKYRIWLPHKNYKVFYTIREKIIYIAILRHAKRKPLHSEYKT